MGGESGKSRRQGGCFSYVSLHYDNRNYLKGPIPAIWNSNTTVVTPQEAESRSSQNLMCLRTTQGFC